MELIARTCRSCGAPLKFQADAERVECLYCGSVYAVKFSGEGIGLRAAKGLDAVARELQIARLKEECRELEPRLQEKSREFETWKVTSILELKTVEHLRDQSRACAIGFGAITVAGGLFFVAMDVLLLSAITVLLGLLCTIIGLLCTIICMRTYHLNREKFHVLGQQVESDRVRFGVEMRKLTEAVAVRQQAIKRLVQISERT